MIYRLSTPSPSTLSRSMTQDSIQLGESAMSPAPGGVKAEVKSPGPGPAGVNAVDVQGMSEQVRSCLLATSSGMDVVDRAKKLLLARRANQPPGTPPKLPSTPVGSPSSTATTMQLPGPIKSEGSASKPFCPATPIPPPTPAKGTLPTAVASIAPPPKAAAVPKSVPAPKMTATPKAPPLPDGALQAAIKSSPATAPTAVPKVGGPPEKKDAAESQVCKKAKTASPPSSVASAPATPNPKRSSPAAVEQELMEALQCVRVAGEEASCLCICVCVCYYKPVSSNMLCMICSCESPVDVLRRVRGQHRMMSVRACTRASKGRYTVRMLLLRVHTPMDAQLQCHVCIQAADQGHGRAAGVHHLMAEGLLLELPECENRSIPEMDCCGQILWQATCSAIILELRMHPLHHTCCVNITCKLRLYIEITRARLDSTRGENRMGRHAYF